MAAAERKRILMNAPEHTVDSSRVEVNGEWKINGKLLTKLQEFQDAISRRDYPSAQQLFSEATHIPHTREEWPTRRFLKDQRKARVRDIGEQHLATASWEEITESLPDVHPAKQAWLGRQKS